MTTCVDSASVRFELATGAGSLPVFERLGFIVRALHDALDEIGSPDVLVDAAAEFPSARERLLHIAALTENAANIVLCKVEETMPLLDAMARQAAALAPAWDSEPAAGSPEAAARTTAMQTFLRDVQTKCGTSRGALSDIMMAQDFQDLTGQLIIKVTALMQRTETDLIKLLVDAAPPGTLPGAVKEELTAGPGAPGHVVLDQQNVDDLLANLGF